MSNDNEEILSVQRETEHSILMGKALSNLQNNADFKLLILEGYLKEKVLASASLLAVPAIKSQNRRPDVMEDLIAASNLSYFLQIVESNYEDAINPVYSDAEEEASNE